MQKRLGCYCGDSNFSSKFLYKTVTVGFTLALEQSFLVQNHHILIILTVF